MNVSQYFIQWNHSRGEFSDNNIYVVLIITCDFDHLNYWLVGDVDVMATRHYLSQCGPGFMSPYGVSRPQRLNVTGQNRRHVSDYISVITNIQAYYKIDYPYLSLILIPMIHYLCYRHLFLSQWCQKKHICFLAYKCARLHHSRSLDSNVQHCAMNHGRWWHSCLPRGSTCFDYSCSSLKQRQCICKRSKLAITDSNVWRVLLQMSWPLVFLNYEDFKSSVGVKKQPLIWNIPKRLTSAKRYVIGNGH